MQLSAAEIDAGGCFVFDFVFGQKRSDEISDLLLPVQNEQGRVILCCCPHKKGTFSFVAEITRPLPAASTIANTNAAKVDI